MDKKGDPWLLFGLTWGVPLLWMVLMRFLSSDAMSGESTSRFVGPMLHWAFPQWNEWQLEHGHYLVRKTAHVVEYAMLTGLWIRAFFQNRQFSNPQRLKPSSGKSHWKMVWIIIVSACISISYAVFDEFMQTFTESRTGNPGDILFDLLGVVSMGGSLLMFRIIGKNSKTKI